MDQVFLSYASKDFHFAQLAQLKLSAADVNVWADNQSLQPGEDWKSEIDRGIDQSKALIVVLSQASVGSSYVTYEWASAMGKGKPIIPILLESCNRHPKIEAIQHIDFSSRTSQPWELLTRRIRQVCADYESTQDESTSAPSTTQPGFPSLSQDYERVAAKVLGYLNDRGFRFISFDRIREKFGTQLTDDWLTEMIGARDDIFRTARLKGGRAGLAKR